MNDCDFAKTLDYAILKPTQTCRDVDAAMEQCAQYGVGCLCVRPCDMAYVKVASALRANWTTAFAVVIGFPHGTTTPAVKAAETAEAFANGADEVDMVVNIARLKEGADDAVLDDIRAVVNAAKGHGAVKVILETCLLTPEEIVRGTTLAIQAGADFVKTSTGFSTHGATLEAVALMVKTAAGRIQVKASGGIRTRAEGEAYLAAGATRLGVGQVACLMEK